MSPLNPSQEESGDAGEPALKSVLSFLKGRQKGTERGQKRRYPWGNDPAPERANYNDTGIGVTSAVGVFFRRSQSV